MPNFVGTTLDNFVHLDMESVEKLGADQQIYIEDIAISLCKKNRFNDHGIQAWAVSDHSIMAAGLSILDHAMPFDEDTQSRAPDPLPLADAAKTPGYIATEALYIFAHDFTEAYVGDCPSPFKRLIPEFGQLENALFNKCILPRMLINPENDITQEMIDKLHKIDHLCGVIEMDMMFPRWEAISGANATLTPWQRTLYSVFTSTISAYQMNSPSASMTKNMLMFSSRSRDLLDEVFSAEMLSRNMCEDEVRKAINDILSVVPMMSQSTKDPVRIQRSKDSISKLCEGDFSSREHSVSEFLATFFMLVSGHVTLNKEKNNALTYCI